MADFGINPINTAIPLGVKQPEGMKISDMLNLAGKGIELQRAQQENQDRKAIQGFMSDPKNYTDENGDIDIDKASKVLPTIAPLMGIDQVKKLTDLSKNHTEAVKAKMGFDSEVRSVVGATYNALANANETNPKAYAQALDNLKTQFPDNKYVKKYVEAAKGNLNNVDDPSKLPSIAKQTAMQMLPTTSQMGQVSLGTIGGQQVIIDQANGTYRAINQLGQPVGPAQPLPNQGTQQVAPVAPQQAQQAEPQQASMMPEEVHVSAKEDLPYPVRQAGTNYAQLPSEQADLEQGQKYRAGLTERQGTLSSSRRNIDEVIGQARKIEDEAIKINSLGLSSASGAWGAINRKIADLTGDPKYKQLSKDLANAQIANMKATGGSMDTVAGQHLAKLANGDETYPPEVLINIAERTKADMRNIDMQTLAANKFAQKFGDNNMKAFQQMWNKNADSKVFQAIDIARDSKLTAEQKKKMTDDLMGTNKAHRKLLERQYQNILRLVNTGTL
ncbi:hypothetical protein [Caudoviricetes sp.]|nr:hypothetical protein [Caudoviricetes sp.]